MDASSEPPSSRNGAELPEDVARGGAVAEGDEPAADVQARYAALVDMLEEGVTVHDAGGRVLAINGSAERILAVSREELLGATLVRPAWSYVEPTGAPMPAVEHPIHVALAEERAVRALVGLRAGDEGELLWLQMSVSPISPGEAGGGPARAICLFADVTFARKEEEDRARNESNFRTLIERTPDAVAVLQRDAIAYANPRMVSLLGYEDADEMLGRLSAEIVHPDDRATLDQLLRNASAQAGASPAAEERFLRRDGAPVPVEVTTLPIFYDGEPATLVHARDLTERKRLEAQVLMADRLASVGRLAAAVGHEINNPLAYVMANLDLALEGIDEIRAAGGALDAATDARLSEMMEMLREAREGSDRVRHIVRDLKVFSRGETEERSRVDPRQVIESCANMAKGEIRHRARLVKRYGDTPPVLASEARLGQVLLNLLVNAAHAIPEGNPDANEILRVDAHRRARARGHRGERHRRRDPREREAAGLRALLHHQGARERHGARSVDLPEHRGGARGADGPRERGGARDDVPGRPARGAGHLERAAALAVGVSGSGRSLTCRGRRRGRGGLRRGRGRGFLRWRATAPLRARGRAPARRPREHARGRRSARGRCRSCRSRGRLGSRRGGCRGAAARTASRQRGRRRRTGRRRRPR